MVGCCRNMLKRREVGLLKRRGGGEKWPKGRGKCCLGDGRVFQMQEVVVDVDQEWEKEREVKWVDRLEQHRAQEVGIMWDWWLKMWCLSMKSQEKKLWGAVVEAGGLLEAGLTGLSKRHFVYPCWASQACQQNLVIDSIKGRQQI